MAIGCRLAQLRADPAYVPLFILPLCLAWESCLGLCYICIILDDNVFPSAALRSYKLCHKKTTFRARIHCHQDSCFLKRVNDARNPLELIVINYYICVGLEFKVAFLV